MKTLQITLLLLGAIMVACQPTISAQPPEVAATPTASSGGLTPAQQAAIASLAKSLAIDEGQIEVASTEAVTWPNGCLGVQPLGVMCTQNQVEGFRILLRTGGKVYELHTNEDGTNVAPVEAMEVPGPAETAAMKQLEANLGVSATDIKVVSSAAVEWPDSCLGVPMEGMLCSQVVTPGHIIVLEAGGQQFEYHTNADASRIIPATLALSWKQEGGIAGVCQSILVYASGEVLGANCGVGGDGRAGVLSEEQRLQLDAWLDQFTNMTIDLSDPQGVADGMKRTANLLGTGSGTPTKEQKSAIFAFAQTLYQVLFP